jgi:nitronate monooxygenase
MALPKNWPHLSVPLIAAPMFLVSGPELVIAAAKAGIVGAFPTLNARTPEQLDVWLTDIGERSHGCAGLVAANLILHVSNPRRETDLDLVVRHRVPWVIASVGSPAEVVPKVHAYGGTVLSDVASVRHARKAADCGVDGLVLLTAGAGGNTGWLNPFAFIDEVRRFWDGPLAVAGGITSGRQIRALQMAGADLAYIGTPFICAEESLAADEYKTALCEAGADDVLTTDAVTGMPANFLKVSLREQGILAADGTLLPKGESNISSWKSAWSAGHGVGAVQRVAPLDQGVRALRADWLATYPATHNQ